jgi:hypothetical protein
MPLTLELLRRSGRCPGGSLPDLLEETWFALRFFQKGERSGHLFWCHLVSSFN